jgi:hypothetical protein
MEYFRYIAISVLHVMKHSRKQGFFSDRTQQAKGEKTASVSPKATEQIKDLFRGNGSFLLLSLSDHVAL